MRRLSHQIHFGSSRNLSLPRVTDERLQSGAVDCRCLALPIVFTQPGYIYYIYSVYISIKLCRTGYSNCLGTCSQLQPPTGLLSCKLRERGADREIGPLGDGRKSPKWSVDLAKTSFQSRVIASCPLSLIDYLRRAGGPHSFQFQPWLGLHLRLRTDYAYAACAGRLFSHSSTLAKILRINV